MTREEAEKAVKGPGKFEGERSYVPYFWDKGLEGFGDDSEPLYITDGSDDADAEVPEEAWVFVVREEDRAVFPELGPVGSKVTLYERDDGFVVEL